MDKLGLGFVDGASAQSADHLRVDEGLPAGAVRSPDGARRSGADDGRARVHDRPGRPSAARGRVGQRRDGRHVRRVRHPRGDHRARPDRPRPVRPERAVREQRVPRRAAHDAVRGDRQARGADAEPPVGVGDLRRVRHGRRRAGVRRRGQRLAVEGVLRGVRVSGPPADASARGTTSACTRASASCRRCARGWPA